ncbi:MAG: cyclic nucleotide-binding domain-containing protein [Desulfobacteraceae bacterium]|nr:MAG: cyclic nucleotide-binding domain-containing protein [Desulfobacteraceae bacterium]
MISLDFLEQVGFFKKFSDHQLAALQKCGEVLTFQRDEQLFAEGAASRHLWIVMEGQVALQFGMQGKKSRDRDAVSFVSESQTFGWSCFVPPYTYRLSGYCAGRKCKVVAMEKDKLLALFEKDAEIGYSVMNDLVCVVGNHFHRFQDELAKQMGNDIINAW